MIKSAKKVCLVIPLIIGMMLTANTAQAQIGFVGGYGMNMFSGPSFTSTASGEFESSGSFNLGLFYDFRMGRVTVRPGLFIRQVNFDWKLDGLDPAFFPISEDLRIAEFPIDFLIHFPTESLRPYAVIGPSFNFMHTDQPDLRQSFDNDEGSTNFTSLTLGAGVEIAPAGTGLVLYPELRFSLALSGFMDEEYIVRTVSYATSESEKISTLTFRLGISLPSY